MKKNITAILALIAAVSMGGCAEKKEANTSDKEKLTYWVEFDGSASATMGSFEETAWAKVLEEKFDVDIEFQHPAGSNPAEKFNIMVSMNDLPDIIEYNWMSYPGGPSKAVKDNIVKTVELEKMAPNLFKYAEENEDVARLIKTNDGEYFGFPFIRGDRYLQVMQGIVVRQDWLDELGLEMPETIDEWEIVLTAFKEKKNAKAPITLTQKNFETGAFIGAYNIMPGLYIDNGKIQYGAAKAEFKDFLAKMNDWYEKGLIQQDFAAIDSKIIDSNMLNSISGATVAAVGGGIGRWMSAATEEGYNLAGAPYPVLLKGTSPEYGQMQLKTPGRFAVLSRDCKNPELATSILDFGYGEEGKMVYNFGVEGESYTMKDSYPEYTETITKNADGLSMSVSMARYMRSYMEGPFIQDKRYMEQYAALPSQKSAIDTWMNTNAEEHIVPHLFLSDADLKAQTKNISSINTYKDEMVAKFIMGIEPIEEFENYVAELKNRGLDEYLSLMQEAYELHLKK